MEKIFLIDLFVSGGPVMIPIALCSIFALAIVFERARFYMRNPNSGAATMKKVKAALATRNFFEAMKVCRTDNTPVATVIAAGLDHADLGREHMLNVMRQEAMVQVKKYERHLNKLSTIASITPMLGLTGTVTGMISAFSVISSVGIGDPTALAGGISEALYTTAAGLLVGIPALVAYNWCEARNAEFVEQVEMHSLDLANQVAAMEVGLEKVAA